MPHAAPANAPAGPPALEFAIIRHGQTPGNAERRYVGVLDQPLSEGGRRQAREHAACIAEALPNTRRVYVSELRRTHETARILFPGAEQVVIGGVQEMDFGDFSGRSADEMEGDAAYRAWVEGDCEGACPNGESKALFTERVCRAVEGLVRAAGARGEERVVLVAHGGTMMAALSCFAEEDRGYYGWHTGNCEGWRMTARFEGPVLRFVDVAAIGQPLGSAE